MASRRSLFERQYVPCGALIPGQYTARFSDTFSSEALKALQPMAKRQGAQQR